VNRILLIENHTLRAATLPGTSGVFSFVDLPDPHRAARYLDRFRGDTAAMFHLRSLLAADSMEPWRLSDDQVVEHAANMIALRRCAVAEALEEEIQIPAAEEEAQAEPPPILRSERKKSWVEFNFVYPDGTPVAGLDYVLEDGNWTAILRDIESVTWSSPRIECEDKAFIKAKVTGYVYGTKAKVNIYREFKESKKDIIETLEGRIENDMLTVEWQYKFDSTKERKAETGVARFVAEVELEGGKRWAKTTTPLEVELKTIKRVAWSQQTVNYGGAVDLLIETMGFGIGAEANLELWMVDFYGEFKKKADLESVTMFGPKSKLRCVYGNGSGAVKIDEAGEYFIVVKIDDRTARSELIWCQEELAGAVTTQMAA
jgi:hypothetical protein